MESKGFRNTDLRVHSATMPTEVGKKFVWVRLGCSDFLSEFSTFATITVWSSMLKLTTRDICNYLFGPSLINPLRILGQEDCDRVLLRKVGNRMFYIKEVGTQKDIFLKTLSNHLFNSFDGRYTSANTLVIDDSPIKPELSTCPFVRVSCPSVRVSWTGLSSIRLALGLPQGKLGVILAYVADTSHSKLAPRMHEHAPRLTRRRL